MSLRHRINRWLRLHAHRLDPDHVPVSSPKQMNQTPPSPQMIRPPRRAQVTWNTDDPDVPMPPPPILAKLEAMKAADPDAKIMVAYHPPWWRKEPDA